MVRQVRPREAPAPKVRFENEPGVQPRFDRLKRIPRDEQTTLQPLAARPYRSLQPRPPARRTRGGDTGEYAASSTHVFRKRAMVVPVGGYRARRYREVIPVGTAGRSSSTFVAAMPSTRKDVQ